MKMASMRKALPLMPPPDVSSHHLEFDEPKKNIFVTQLGDQGRSEADGEPQDDVNKYPIVKESAAQLIETGLNTTQKTLLLKREVEVDRVTEELRVKREEFKERMELCEKRRSELQHRQQQLKETGLNTTQKTLLLKREVEVDMVSKELRVKREEFKECMELCRKRQSELQHRQQQMKDRVKKFEKFIDETEAKRKRAIHRYQTELRLKEQKEIELQQLRIQLEELKKRHSSLKKRIQTYQKFEDYLMKVLDDIPDNYLEVNDSMLVAIMDRHRTLAGTNQSLVERVQDIYDEVEAATKELNDLKTNHVQQKLVINKQLADFQNVQEEKTDMNTQLEERYSAYMTSYRDRNELLGRIKMAITNVSERCIKPHDPPVDDMDYMEKLALIKNFIADKTAIVEMASIDEDMSAT